MGPALGGGFGIYMGYFGLMLDNILAMTVVLANGTVAEVSSTSHSDLYWAMRGAGHNFGVVTSFTQKIYDDPGNVFYAEMQFAGDKIEAFFEVLNKFNDNGNQPKKLASAYALFVMNPEISKSDVSPEVFALAAQSARLISSCSQSYYCKLPTLVPNRKHPDTWSN